MALSVTIGTPSASSTVSSDDGQGPQSPMSPVGSYPVTSHMSSPSQALTSKAKGTNIKNAPSLNKSLITKGKPQPAEISTEVSRASSNSSATTATPASAVSNAAPKRKPSRRANTAERRATHNMVERQRRETLNGRFLDLSHLLPNLSQIRRPSKSSIVNSSIAHIQASRRHRLLASRVCLALAGESDGLIEENEALKRELNEWRDRAGLPRVALRDKDQAPSAARGEGFRTIIGGELEVVMAVGGEEGGDEDEEGENKYGGYSLGGDVDMDESPDSPEDSDQGEPMMTGTNPFAHNLPTPPTKPATSVRPSSARPSSAVRPISAVSAPSRRQSVSQNGPPAHRRASISQMHPDNNIIAVPSSSLAFENPAMGMAMNGGGLSHVMYEHHYSPQIPGVPFEKIPGLYGADGSLFTPPSSSHGLRERKERSSRERERDALMFIQRQHEQHQQQQVAQQQQQQNSNTMLQQHYAQAQQFMLQQAAARDQAIREQAIRSGHHYACRASPDGDDCSSVGSSRSGGRPRSGSNGGSAQGSGYGSPDDHWQNNELMVPSDGTRYDNRRYDVGFDLPMGINIPLGINMGNIGGMVDIDHDFSSPEYDPHPLTPEEFDVPRRAGLRM